MAKLVTLRGADVKLYLAGKLYAEVQGINYTIDYGVDEIRGIDSQFAQELVPTRISVQGTVSGLYIKLVGGLQAYNARPGITDLLSSPYFSIRIKDRSSDTDVIWIPQAMVVSESVSIPSKGTVKINFTFKGIIPYQPLDLNG